jgi:hypothetical protein
MFYLFLPLAVALFLTSGCEAHNPEIKRVFFENHSYICFTDVAPSTYMRGTEHVFQYIHDPDCKCYKR